MFAIIHYNVIIINNFLFYDNFVRNLNLSVQIP